MIMWALYDEAIATTEAFCNTSTRVVQQLLSPLGMPVGTVKIFLGTGYLEH
jgi:hypothetical protein